MKFQERHKYFALDCFAQFMTRQETTEAFIQKFKDELPKPPEPPKEPTKEYQHRKHFDVRCELQTEREIYKHRDPLNGEINFAKARCEIRKKAQDEFDEKNLNDHLNELHQEQIEQHEAELHEEISNQIRRYNIKDSQFPQKYMAHFHKKRKEYYQKRTQDINNVKEELELIYGHIKNEVFQTDDPDKALKHANTAHALLKTINSLND